MQCSVITLLHMQAAWQGAWTQKSVLEDIPEDEMYTVPNIGMLIACRSLQKVASEDAWLNCDVFAVMTTLFQVNLQCINRHLC